MPKFSPDNPGQPTFRPQFPVRAEDMRLLASQAQQGTRNAVTGDENDLGAGAGHQGGAELMPEGFWARLTTPAVDANTPLYSFCEVQDDGTGKGWTPPHAPLQGISLAHEANNNVLIPVPGPPTGLTAAPKGQSLSYVVTATWVGAQGKSYQSAFSNEVGTTSGGGVLNWTAPAPCAGFTLTGFQVWRSLLGKPGVECVLVASVNSSTTTYTDGGAGGTLLMPIPGGTAGPIVWLSPKSLYPYYKFRWSDTAASNLAWVKATTATPTQVYLGRTITDGVITGTTTLTSNTANFTSDDTGAIVIGTGIPSNTTITFVNSTTATLSNASTNGTGLTVQIVTGSIKAYAAKIDTQSTKTGVWSDGQTVWLQQANDSAWQALVGGVEPVSVPVVNGQIYQCRYFGTDDQNVPIWTVAQVDNLQEVEASVGTPVSLTTSWANIAGMSVVLPPGQTWKATVQLTADITTSASGAGDSISFRLMDSGSTQWGVQVDCANGICDSITFTDAAYLQGTGSGGVTLNVQGIVNTSTASTGQMKRGSIIATTL